MPPLGSALVHPVHCQSGWKGPSAIASRGRRPHSSLLRCDGFVSFHQFLQCSKVPSGLKRASPICPNHSKLHSKLSQRQHSRSCEPTGERCFVASLNFTGKLLVSYPKVAQTAASAAPHIPVSLGSRGLKGPQEHVHRTIPKQKLRADVRANNATCRPAATAAAGIFSAAASALPQCEKKAISPLLFLIVFCVATQCPAMMTKQPNGLLVIATIGRQQFLRQANTCYHRRKENKVKRQTRFCVGDSAI